MRKKLAIVTTHPIQYYAPLFRLLAKSEKVQPKVFYTWPQAITGFDDPDFEKTIQWDIPLLEGYDFELVENVSGNPNSKKWNGIDCPNLVEYIKKFSPDAILVYGWNHKSHFQVMRYFKGKIPVWFRGDSTLLDEKPGIRKIIRRIFLKWVYSYVDKAFFVGKNNRNYFLAHGLKTRQLIYAPHAVDNERFFDCAEKNYERKAKEWRRELGYSEDDFVVLFAGKFEPKKNPCLLVDAVIKANEKLLHYDSPPILHLLMVGNGPLEKELRVRAADKYFVKFLSFQNQSKMPMVYRLGDMFCLPSKGPGETWGLAINEALACGVPVVVSDLAGASTDLVQNGVNGYIFQSGNVINLIESILRIVEWDKTGRSEAIIKSIVGFNFHQAVEAFETEI